MVPAVQVASGRRSFFLIIPQFGWAKKQPACNYYARRVFMSEGPCSIARRRLCDAKTQFTIPGAQLPSSICESLRSGGLNARDCPRSILSDLHSSLRWTTIFACKPCPQAT